MLTITSSAAMAAFLAQSLDPTLRRTLTDRVEQLAEHEGYDLGELVHFLIVQPGDTLDTIVATLGFSIARHDPETVTDHGSWVEAVFVVSDDGFGWVLLVPGELTIPLGLEERFRSTSEPPRSR